MIAAEGLDDGLGSAARVQTAAGRSTVTSERFERRAESPDSSSSSSRRRSTRRPISSKLAIAPDLNDRGRPVPFPELVCWVERDATPSPAQAATLPSDPSRQAAMRDAAAIRRWIKASSTACAQMKRGASGGFELALGAQPVSDLVEAALFEVDEARALGDLVDDRGWLGFALGAREFARLLARLWDWRPR